MRIHCLGIAVADALSGPIAEYPIPKVHPQVTTTSLRFAPGGGAVNTGTALARLGQEVAVFSKVGEDANGQFLLKELEDQGVCTHGIVRAAGESTPFTFVGIHPDGDRTFIHTPGTNLTFSLADLDLERLLQTDVLLYQDHWVLPRLDGAPAAGLLAEAQRRGVITVLDECWGLGPNRETLELVVPHCDYVLPSFDDLRAIYPEASANQVADHLLGLGAKTVVLKLGAQGCLLATHEGKEQIPALPAQVVDTTGAGDCWDAGFLAGLAEGLDLRQACRFGHSCAAFCIEAIGATCGLPDYAAVKRRAAFPAGNQ